MKKILLTICLISMGYSTYGAIEKTNWINTDGINVNNLDKIISNTRNGIISQKINGKKYNCGLVLNGVTIGKWVFYYDNGRVKSEYYFNKGYPDGRCVTYYENGNKELEAFFSNGILNGKYTTYYETGEKSMETYYKNGLQDGKLINYNKDGSIKGVLEYKYGVLLTKDTDTILNNIEWIYLGTLTVNSNNGMISSQIKNGTVYQNIGEKRSICGNMVNGMAQGLFTLYYDNGNPFMISYYINGLPAGKMITFYESGEKMMEAFFENGKKVGKSIYYDKNGKIYKKI